MASKRPGVALGLWGPPGIGKSHTAELLLRELPCRTATVHATASSAGLMRALPKPERLPAWTERTLSQLAANGHVELEPLTQALGAVLVAAAPFVLHVEDLHETTLERFELWVRLAQTVVRARGVALLVTSRSVLPEPFESVALQPLEAQDARKLLEQEAGAHLPHEAVAWIESHAQGNPMFTLEYFRHLSRSGYLWSDGSRWRWREPHGEVMPTSVEAVIAHHLQAVGEQSPAGRALLARAVLRLEAPVDLWARVADLTVAQLQVATLDLEGRGILLNGRFTHPLYREVTLENTSKAQRRDAARRAVHGLAADPVAASLYLEDAALEAAEAQSLLSRAVTLERAAGHVGQAARLQVQLSGYTPASDRAGLLLEAATWMTQVSVSEALEIAWQAQREAPQDVAPALLLAELLAHNGRMAEAEKVLAQLSSLGLADSDERMVQTRLLVRHHARDSGGVLELFEQYKDAQPNLPMYLIARAHVQLRQFAEANAVLTQAFSVPSLPNLELAELLYVRAFVPHFAGDFETSDLGFSAYLHTLKVLDDGSLRFKELRAGALQLRAYARNGLDNPVGATADILASMELTAGFGDGLAYAFKQTELALYWIDRGEYRQAEDELQEARAFLEGIGHAMYLSILERIASRLYLEMDSSHGPILSLKHAQAALRWARGLSRASIPSVLAGALLAAAWAEVVHGSPVQALQHADELEVLARQTRLIPYLATANWIRGLALERNDQRAAAINMLEQALREAQPIPLGPSPRRMRFELDRLRDDATAAKTHLEYVQAREQGNLVNIILRYFPALSAAPAVVVGEPAVRLEVLGAMAVNGEAVSVRSRKGKELLALLLEARLNSRPELPDLDLFDALYPEMDEESATNALKQLVYRLRSGLGPDVIVRTSGGYALGSIQSDAEAFLRSGDTQLWRGPYLADLGETWASSARDALYFALRQAITAGIAADGNEALRLARILMEAEPYDLEALRLALQVARANGDKTAILGVYSASRHRLEEVGEHLPESWESFLMAVAT